MMPDEIDGSNPVADAAERLARLGISVIPIARSTKEPPAGFRWGQFAGRIADLSERYDWFVEHDHQLAVVPGTVSGNLIPLDYDGPGGFEAHAAQYPILRTYPRVRTGSGKHHVWVRSATPVKKYVTTLPDGSKLEVRAGTHYTLCPPSLHPSGGAYTWEVEPWGGIPVIDLATIGLRAPVATEAEQAAPVTEGPALTEAERETIIDLVTPHYQPTHRHDLVLALSGWLAGYGVPEADAAAMVGRLADDHGDAGRKAEYARGVRDTYKKARAGVAVVGWSALTASDAPLVSPATAKRLDLLLRGRAPTVSLTLPKAMTPAPVAIDNPDAIRNRGITLAALQRKHFEPMHWIVDGVLPEGAALLAGKPKSKKSWVALGIGLAVATDGRVMDRWRVSPGHVLYLDLEGNQRRIKSRVGSILGYGAMDWPANFTVETTWERGAMGLAALRVWLEARPDTRLIVIDVLAEFRDPTNPKANPYEADREAVVGLNKLAEEFHCAILLIHHTRKMKADDQFDEISGTTGLSSGVGTMWLLSRMPDGLHTQLSLRGRDLIDMDNEMLALEWKNDLCLHIIAGTAEEIGHNAERQAIIDLLSDDQVRTPREIAEAVGKTVNAVNLLLLKLLHAGAVDKVGYGKYAIVPRPVQPSQRKE